MIQTPFSSVQIGLGAAAVGSSTRLRNLSVVDRAAVPPTTYSLAVLSTKDCVPASYRQWLARQAPRR